MNGSSSILIRFVIFAVTFMHVSNVTNYVQSLRIGFVQWNFWLVGIGICAILALFSGAFFRMSKATFSYFLWAGAFVGVLLLSLLIVDAGQVAVDGTIEYLWFFGSGLALALLIRNAGDTKACGLGVVIAVMTLAILTIMEFLDPNFQVIVDRIIEDVNEVGVLNRAGALYENPNDNGTAMVLGMFLGQFFLPKRFRLVFFLFVGVAIFCTVSRGSLTAWALAVFLSLILGFGASTRFLGLVGLSFIGALGYLLVAGQIPDMLASVNLDQLLSGNMRERLSQNFFTQDDGSTTSRLLAAQVAFQTFLQNPYVGIGIGASGQLGEGIGTHNQHLKIATELGIFGLMVYACVFLVALNQRSIAGMSFLLIYAVIGFTNHGMMTYTVFSVLLPLALVSIPELHHSETQQLQSRQKRRRRKRSRKPSGSERTLSA